jgi:3-oxoacyl-[acyl-carrier-protein] synthase III
MSEIQSEKPIKFYDRPNVEMETLPFGDGIPLGIERVQNPRVGIGGAYAGWGIAVDNQSLPQRLEERLGEKVANSEVGELDELGFYSRHHLPDLSPEEHQELEIEVGARLLQKAAEANDWRPDEIEGVLIGMSSPVCEDYLERICQKAGISHQALKVSVHKACDGSVGSLHLALNPFISLPAKVNIAEELRGKKVLVGGIEGLSRFLYASRDVNALQLFGNGAGVIGIIPGETIKFLSGATREAYDEEGVLQVKMTYPHSRQQMLEVTQAGESHLRVAGLMHEPEGDAPIAMAGMMGMVKLFIRNGVQVVVEVYRAYQQLMDKLGEPGKQLAVAIAHHANYKINKLKEKQVHSAGIPLNFPWLLHDFGNVSAASNMIAFLRYLPNLNPGDHILIDGFGAGTFYDSLTVALA